MNNLISFQNYLKPSGELPKHITHSQYVRMRELPKEVYQKGTLQTKQEQFMIDRDVLLLDFMWETGGRIGDIVNTIKTDFDFRDRILNLRIKKTKITIKINLTQEMINDLLRFYNDYNREPLEMVRQNAWSRIKKYSQVMGLHIHPHMFRHGLALYLLSQGIPLPIISYRLGHRSLKTTMDFYMKVTPDIERQILKEVVFR